MDKRLSTMIHVLVTLEVYMELAKEVLAHE